MTNKTEGALKKRVLSGIQPTGEVHLGNYLGALRQWVDMQQEYDCFYSIVDQHAILGSGDPTTLPGRTVEMAISLLSVGLDPEKCTIFVQSDVPEHIELSWLFNVIAPVGDLERMTQYKDKSARYDSIPAGLLNYPILQAADILIYRAEAVPVGEDQKQHLELTRDIARKWNARYGDLFPIPEAIVPNTGRIRGLDGNKKMSKSLDNTVGIFSEEEAVWSAIRTAVTDPQRIRKDDPGRPEVCNVFTLHRLLGNQEKIGDIEKQCVAGSRGCVDCKRILSGDVASQFAPFRERAEHYRSDLDQVKGLLEAGRDKARKIASVTLEEVRQRMGLDWRSIL